MKKNYYYYYYYQRQEYSDTSLEDVASSTHMLALMHSKAAEKRTCRSCLFVTCTALVAVA